MNTTHSEPWHVHAGPMPSQLNVLVARQDENGTNSICVMDIYNGNRADAARIVACVNACSGMADPATEIAALREALEAMVSAFEHQEHNYALQEGALDQARAALKGAREHPVKAPSVP